MIEIIINIFPWALLVLVMPFVDEKIQKLCKHQKNKNNGHESFVIKNPAVYQIIFLAAMFFSFLVVAYFPKEANSYKFDFFDIFFGIIFISSLLCFVLTSFQKKVVEGNKITVYFYLFKKSFTFDDIVSAKLEKSKQTDLAEEPMSTIIVKTTSKLRIEVGTYHTSYEKFLKKLIASVPREKLIGFEEYFEQQN